MWVFVVLVLSNVIGLAAVVMALIIFSRAGANRKAHLFARPTLATLCILAGGLMLAVGGQYKLARLLYEMVNRSEALTQWQLNLQDPLHTIHIHVQGSDLFLERPRSIALRLHITTMGREAIVSNIPADQFLKGPETAYEGYAMYPIPWQVVIQGATTEESRVAVGRVHSLNDFRQFDGMEVEIVDSAEGNGILPQRLFITPNDHGLTIRLFEGQRASEEVAYQDGTRVIRYRDVYSPADRLARIRKQKSDPVMLGFGFTAACFLGTGGLLLIMGVVLMLAGPRQGGTSWQPAPAYEPSGEKPELSLGKKILFTILCCSLSVVVIELMLQVFYKPQPVCSGWKLARIGCKSHMPTLPEINELGFRGQPIEYSSDDFVIVLLGDSHVEAAACSLEWMPERRLERHLQSNGKKVRVFSVGAGGYGQDQELLSLKEYFSKFQANLVILWFTPENDIFNNVFPTHWPKDGFPKPTFWLEKGELRGPQEEMGQELAEPVIKLLALWRRVFPLSRNEPWEKKFLPKPYLPMTEFTGDVREDWQEGWNNNLGLWRQENLDNEQSHFAIRFTPRSERMQYGLDLTRKLLREIEQLAASHGSNFVIFLPTHSSAGARAEDVYVLNGKYYRTSEHQFVENLNYVHEGFKRYLIPITIERWNVGPADGHLNPLATDQVMHDLAKAIEPLTGNSTREVVPEKE